MSTYRKNDVYMINLEGVEQGLFVGISNKHYDELYKYYCFLTILDDTNNINMQQKDKDYEELNKLQRDLEFEKAHSKFWKEMTCKLQSALGEIINKMQEGDKIDW